MHNQKLHFPLMNRERLEERLSHIKTSDLHDAKTARLYNDLHADLGELNRRDLVTKYGITIDDFGKYNHIERVDELIRDGLRACQAYIAELNMDHISDDGSDYLSAVSDQLGLLAELYSNFDDAGSEPVLLEILNATEEATINDQFQNAMAFRYGYADHGSPISDLAYLNYEDI